jgi:hypothetical protein
MPRAIDSANSPFHFNRKKSPPPKVRKKQTTPDGEDDWAPVFIGAIMQGMSLSDSAKRANISLTMIYKRNRKDEVFRRSWKEAAYIGTTLLEQEAMRRAFHGVIEPVFYKGEECGGVRKYDNTLLMNLLRSRRPEIYRDNGNNGDKAPCTLNINVVSASALPQENCREIGIQVVTDDGNQQDNTRIRETSAVS